MIKIQFFYSDTVKQMLHKIDKREVIIMIINVTLDIQVALIIVLIFFK